MTLVLKIESSTSPQPRTEYRYDGGVLVIGRGEDADWRLNDPDNFISRSHCRVSMDGDDYVVTDTSRGGLLVDGSPRPLGPGNIQRLENKMRLRLGDLVIVAQIEAPDQDASLAPQPTVEPEHVSSKSNGKTKAFEPLKEDPFFSTSARQVSTEPKPKDLPDPFEVTEQATSIAEAESEVAAHPDDPFKMDPFSPAEEIERAKPEEQAEPRTEVRTEPQIAKPVSDPGPDDQKAAFFKGLGLAPDFEQQINEAEMEEIGRRMRLVIGGLVDLLRSRTREKTDFRVEMTAIGREDVNPLKFLPTLDEAIQSIIQHKGPGYLPPDRAIHEAFQDLIDHRARSWHGIQSALRQMIDRFEPKQFEYKAASKGRLEQLLEGGKSATLWKLYTEEFEEISRAAEDKFLGDAGDYFRDAYEARGGMSNA
ncbi:MAG: type VI secretion system-associated FHA domain protein TagH [Pseudomonadota bacterium]